MKVSIRYKNDRLDIFDTDSFTKSDPFDGTSMLTNFEVRMDLFGDTGLWLMVHRYDAADGYAKDVPSTEVPIARRKRGWRFLLAESGELDSIECVSIDGDPILMRIAGELADMVRFEQMCALWLTDTENTCVTERVVSLYDRLYEAYGADPSDDKKIARMCGLSSEAIEDLRGMIPKEEESWMEGD